MKARFIRLALAVGLSLLLSFWLVGWLAHAQGGQPPIKGVTPTPAPKSRTAQASGALASAAVSQTDYSGSTFTARGAHPGETITYTLIISNSGNLPGLATTARISIPSNAIYVPGSAQAQGGGALNVNGSQIEWQGAVASGQAVTITFRVTLPIIPGEIVSASATLHDPGLASVLVLKNRLRIQSPAGGPDAFGYTYQDSLAPGSGVTFSWIPTTPLSTKLNFGSVQVDDVVTGPIPLGFSLNLYTGTYTTTYINSNGLVMFGAANASNTDNTPTPIPTMGDTDNYAACLWADLYIQDSTQGIWVERFGSAPNRSMVITFRAGYFPTSFLPVPPALFQMILSEGSNRVKCQYKETSGPFYGSGAQSAIGLENVDGTAGIQYFYDLDYSNVVIGPLEDGLAIEFTPGPAALPVYVTSNLSASYNIHPGDIATYTLAVRNSGLMSGAATQVTDPIPPGTTYVNGSAQVVGGGALTANAAQIAWLGVVGSGQAVTISFQVRLPTTIGAVITNTALITDPQAAIPVTLTDSSLCVQPPPTGGPDAFGYTYQDSYAPGGPTFNWIPTTTASVKLNFGVLPADDVFTGPITIGFPLNFYAGVYTQTFVSSNGLVSFGSGSDHNINTPIPTAGDGADNFASCFWGDLYIKDAAQGVWVERFGSAPNRYTTITFRATYFADNNAPPALFQMILYEGSNQIKCQYADMAGSILATGGGGATIGLENADGTSGIEYFYKSQLTSPSIGPLESGLALLFTPGPEVPVMAASAKSVSPGDHPGEVVTYTLGLYNNGSAPSSITSSSDPIPTGAAYVPGSAHAQGGGLVSANSSAVNWQGTLVNSGRVTVTYQATLTAPSGWVTNTATIGDPVAVTTVVKSAATAIQPYEGWGSGAGEPHYFYRDSYAPGGSVTFGWVPTSAASSQISITVGDNDDGYSSMPIGFPFRFFGSTFLTASVSTNGLVMFNDIGSTDFNPDPIPTPGKVDNYATCFWSDQKIANAAQGIWYETFGGAPNRFTVITFVLSDTASISVKSYQYQMILYEAGGRVVCQYLDMGGSINGDGRQATIGLENSWGDSGVQYSFGSGAPYGPIENNLAILFQPGVAVSGVTINGPTVGVTDTAYVFTSTVSPISATTPIHLIWSPTPDSGQGTTAATYTWASAGMRAITVTAANVGGAVSNTHTITISGKQQYRVYLPLVMRR